MSKRVVFGARPPSQQPLLPVAEPDAAAIDAWVNDEPPPPAAEPIKRFTFEVPLSLHKRIKMACAARDRQMAEVLRELLDTHFPAG